MVFKTKGISDVVQASLEQLINENNIDNSQWKYETQEYTENKKIWSQLRHKLRTYILSGSNISAKATVLKNKKVLTISDYTYIAKNNMLMYYKNMMHLVFSFYSISSDIRSLIVK